MNDEIIESANEKAKFSIEFYRTTEILKKSYPSKAGQEKDIVGTIINNLLLQIYSDCSSMDFIAFYKKYLKGTLYLDCSDFTKHEIINIIDNTCMSERDSKLARYYWVDMKSEDDIAYELGIDRKTVRNNIPKISMMLKMTCAKIIK